jgi:replication-associated recombination protein RarA
MGNQYQAATKLGYDLFEASSAFQKSIRRGLRDMALHFGVELDRSGYGEYVWKRMRIISSEDIGLAEPNISANIQALYQMWVDQRKKKDEKHAPERLFLVHAIIMLCQAKKSRLVDWTLITYYADQTKRDIPDFAFDKHNQKGRMMKRGVDHFVDEGAQLENHHPQLDEEEMKERARAAMKGNGGQLTLIGEGGSTEDGREE